MKEFQSKRDQQKQKPTREESEGGKKKVLSDIRPSTTSSLFKPLSLGNNSNGKAYQQRRKKRKREMSNNTDPVREGFVQSEEDDETLTVEKQEFVPPKNSLGFDPLPPIQARPISARVGLERPMPTEEFRPVTGIRNKVKSGFV